MKNILLLVLCPISNFSLVGKCDHGNAILESGKWTKVHWDHESLVGVAVLTSYNAKNIPGPAPAILPAQTPGTSPQEAPAGRRSGRTPPGLPPQTRPRAQRQLG